MYQIPTSSYKASEDGQVNFDQIMLKILTSVSRPDNASKGYIDIENALCQDVDVWNCLLYTSPSPRDATLSRMPSSA